MFYNNLIYNFLLERKSSSEINFIPENLWAGNPDEGKKLSTVLKLYGKVSLLMKEFGERIMQVSIGMRNFTPLNGLKT